ALGISKMYLYRLKREADKDAVSNVIHSMYQQNKVQQNIQRKKLDDFDEDLITRTVHDLYIKGNPVTISKLQNVLREKDVNVSQTTVRK
ncbi:hypothetical protein ACJMK2_031437, partial [Sinanodonta woodiana]